MKYNPVQKCKIELPRITKEDFVFMPTQESIARKFIEYLSSIAHQKHDLTQEDIYSLIEKQYVDMFNEPLPWASYEAFRKWIPRNKKRIYSRSDNSKINVPHIGGS